MKKNYINPLTNIVGSDLNIVICAGSDPTGSASEYQQGATGDGHPDGTDGIGTTGGDEFDQGSKRRGYFYN